MRVQRFDYALAGMKKPDNWIVYPRDPGDPFLKVQGNRAIARIDTRTGEGVLNWKGSNAKYNIHLALGEAFTFPKEFVELCIEHAPQRGDEVGPGVLLG